MSRAAQPAVVLAPRSRLQAIRCKTSKLSILFFPSYFFSLSTLNPFHHIHTASFFTNDPDDRHATMPTWDRMIW